MKLSQFKQQLDTISAVNFMQPNKALVPQHFHITEAGLTTKHFIDCCGTLRTEKVLNFQVWVAQDFSHRLDPAKLKKIIAIAENNFGNEDLEIEVEYQTETVGRYGLDSDGKNFLLIPKQTDCLAKDNCGVPQEKQKLQLAELETTTSCCTPRSGCC